MEKMIFKKGKKYRHKKNKVIILPQNDYKVQEYIYMQYEEVKE